jgi:RHS repeat-associated protein
LVGSESIAAPVVVVETSDDRVSLSGVEGNVASPGGTMHHRGSALRRILPLLVVILFVAVLVGGSGPAGAYCMLLGDESGGGCEPPSYNNPSTLSVEVTAPKPGATVKDVVTITSNPGGVKNAEVNRVEFYVDNVLIGIDLSNPWRTDWNTLDPDFVAYDGTHSLTSIAYTNTGRATSPAVSVTTANTAGTQYRATITSTPVPQEVQYDAAGTQLTYPVDVTVRNNSAFTWTTTAVKLNYRWYSPDPTPVVTNGTAIAFPANVPAATTRTLRVNVLPPTLTTGISKAQYQLRFDLVENGTTWFASKGNAPLENPVIDAKVLEAEALGLEKFYHYEGEELGAGMQHLLNVANGNSLLRWTPWQSPGRGLATVLDITYNSLEKKCECPLGNNFSVALSTLNRLGLPLDIHPNNADTIAGRSNKYVVFTDGDGTPQKFVGRNASDGTTYWEEPPGVHLHLRSISTDPLAPRYWAVTRPDRVTWYFDKEGYPTSVEDRNGNAITYTLSAVQPGDDPGGVKKRITKVTDAGGDFFAIDYFTKAEVKKPQIRGKIQSITDHGGHRLLFDYYADGNLRKIIQEGGTKANGITPLPSRSFVFTYTTSDGSGPAIPTPALRVDPDPETSNQSTRLYSVRDPRGAETLFTYYGPTSGQLRWRLQSRTNRTSHTTNYAYDLVNRVATVTDPLTLVSKYAYDTSGQVTSITNPKNQVTSILWTADRMIQRITDPGGAYREFAYNANGYITDEWDQLRNQTHLDYENVATGASDVSGKWKAGRSIPHISQVASVTAPKGMATTGVADDYQTLFLYDAKGNMTRLTGPEGHPSPSDLDGQFTEYGWNPDGTLARETDANGKTTTFAYDNQGLVTSQTDPLGRVTQFSYDRDGNLKTIQDPRHAGISGGSASDYQLQFFYDAFHRMGKQTAPKRYVGEPGVLVVSAADFDANDNLVSQTQPYYSSGGTLFTTTYAYDAMDRLTRETNPDTSVLFGGEMTDRAYDADGRLVKVTEPKGVPTAAPNDFAKTFAYDELDRVIRESRYETDTSGNVTKTLTSHYCYDPAGDLRSETRPKAGLTQVDCAALIAGTARPAYTTTYTYDAAHKRLNETDPHLFTKSVSYDRNDNVVTETNELGYTASRDYDQRDLLVKFVQPVEPGTLGTGDREATTRWFYDPVGNRMKEVSPRGWDASPDPEPNKTTFTKYFTTYEYDDANQLVRTVLPTNPDDPKSREQHYLHRSYDANGALAWTSLPVKEALPGSVNDVDKHVYTRYDTGWIRTSKSPARPEVTFEYRPEGWQSKRTPQGRPSESWTYFADGAVQVHTDSETKTTTFSYDANDNQTRVDDRSGSSGSETPIDVDVTYDSLDRRTKIVQKKQGKPYWLFTTMAYDANDKVIVREDDGRQDPTTGNVTKQPRRNEYTYDQADWVTEQLDRGPAAGCSDDRRITTDYFKTSWLRFKKVYRGNASCGWDLRVDTAKDYFANGQLNKIVTKNGAGAVKESHTLSYLDANGHYANGNRTKDDYVRERPGGGSCTSTSCSQTYTYDAEDRLVEWADGRGGTTTYTLDPHGNIAKQVDSLGTVDSTYDGDLLKTQSFNGTLQRRYWYDTSGNLDCVTTPAGTQASCPQQGTDSQPANVLEDWTYDGLDRAKDTHNYQLGDSADYTYDAFDRVASESEKHSGATKTTTFDYLGVSQRVTTETQTGSSNTTKEYSYDAWGNRVSLKASGSQSGDWDYGYDARGSVSQLLDQAGQAKASYGYKPYGEEDTGATGGDPERTNPINAYRYDSKRLDPGSGTLQMGARVFSPTTSRFTQGDLYKGALDDLDLATDPLTQNRYSLAGGNPINFVEVDGHWPDFVDDAIDAVGDAASSAVDAVAGAAEYCLGEGARNCAMVAGGVALAATGVGAIAGAGAIATGAFAVAAGAEAASAGFSLRSYQRTGDPIDLVSAGLSAVGAGGAAQAARSGLRGLQMVRRAKELHGALDETAQRMRTTSLLRAVGDDGAEQYIVGHSGRTFPGRLQSQLFREGEVAARGSRGLHAERAALRTARDLGLKPREIVAVSRTQRELVSNLTTKPICYSCYRSIRAAGARARSRLDAAVRSRYYAARARAYIRYLRMRLQ